MAQLLLQTSLLNLAPTRRAFGSRALCSVDLASILPGISFEVRDRCWRGSTCLASNRLEEATVSRGRKEFPEGSRAPHSTLRSSFPNSGSWHLRTARPQHLKRQERIDLVPAGLSSHLETQDGLLTSRKCSTLLFVPGGHTNSRSRTFSRPVSRGMCYFPQLKGSNPTQKVHDDHPQLGVINPNYDHEFPFPGTLPRHSETPEVYRHLAPRIAIVHFGVFHEGRKEGIKVF